MKLLTVNKTLHTLKNKKYLALYKNAMYIFL